MSKIVIVSTKDGFLKVTYPDGTVCIVDSYEIEVPDPKADVTDEEWNGEGVA